MKKYILLAATAISLTACNTEDNYTEEPIAAQITASIGESVLSRASDNSWDNGDAIGVSMSGHYTNIEYVTEHGDGVFDGALMYFKNKQQPVTLSAYYPYSGTEGQTPALITATTDVGHQTESEQRKFDFLYAIEENVTGNQPNVKFTFSHKMCKLTLVFKNGNKGTDVGKITSCEINGLILDGAFNPLTGECNADAAKSATALTLTPAVINEKALPSLIFFPQTVDKVTLKITDKEAQEYSCELKFPDNRLESGNNYLYTITVNKTGLKVEDYAISNWTESGLESEAKSE